MDIVVIVPANNEEAYIEPCLRALLAQEGGIRAHVIVSANACRDRTVEIAQGLEAAFAGMGHALICLDSDAPGKAAALNRAEAAIPEALAALPRAYLDADVLCDPDLLAQIVAVLSVDAPRYATGTIEVQRSGNAFTRSYARVWVRLPFVTAGAVGAGFFAVNATGRRRWDSFPQIISDDTFVRLNFAAHERIEVPARYHWPMVQGFSALVRVRRRQDDGVQEVAALYPQLMRNEGKPKLGRTEALRILVTDPVGFLTYLLVHVAVRLTRQRGTWDRGR